MLIELLNHRRAVRHYSEQPIDADTVRTCLEQARLAPSSSNMQLYQFIHVTDPATLQALATACLGQQSATTAQQMVVFVTRQDLFGERARAVMAMEADNLRRTSPPEKQEKPLPPTAPITANFCLSFMHAASDYLGFCAKYCSAWSACSARCGRIAARQICASSCIKAARSRHKPSCWR